MRALLLIDLQVDFFPGGALAVPGADAIVPRINELIASDAYDLRVATQDWHPKGHGSFASTRGVPVYTAGELAGLPQTFWPDHCVEETPGAAIVESITRRFDAVFRKGTDPAIDSYSAFFDNARRKDTGLDAWLRARGVTELDVVGVATDYCVKASVLDALSLGYPVRVLEDAVRAVELVPGDGERALVAMADGGAVRLRS